MPLPCLPRRLILIRLCTITLTSCALPADLIVAAFVHSPQHRDSIFEDVLSVTAQAISPSQAGKPNNSPCLSTSLLTDLIVRLIQASRIVPLDAPVLASNRSISEHFKRCLHAVLPVCQPLLYGRRAYRCQCWMRTSRSGEHHSYRQYIGQTTFGASSSAGRRHQFLIPAFAGFGDAE